MSYNKSSMKVVIWSHFISPRLQYVSQWLADRWGAEVFINAEIPAQEGIMIHYGNNHSGACALSIPDSGLLSHNGINPIDLKVNKTGSHCKLFYDGSGQLDLDFDYFSMVFYLITRYEEYQENETDMHGRWISSQSAAVVHRFLQYPLIDLWLTHIEGIIESKSPYRFNRSGAIRYVPTVDVDIPYAYKHKEWRNLAGLVRDTILGARTKVNARLAYLRNHIDPYDTYDYLLEQLQPFAEATFFFLCTYHKPFDENHLIEKDEFKQLVRRIAVAHHIGIHPSYASDSTVSALASEIGLLASITDLSIISSRQHFLKMSMPQTYQALIRAGITSDHSMMYADRIGFRASTCHPFRWYDLSQESSTDLIIHSPCLMDVTLKKYLKLGPNETFTAIDDLKKSISAVDGTFEFIWHNSSFSAAHGWEGWDKVFEYLLKT
jgi:hypothetical protein